LQQIAKQHKAENPHLRPIVADGIAISITATNSLQTKATNHASIWPKDVMKTIKKIIKLHSPHPVLPFIVIEMTSDAAKKKNPRPEKF
jgi:hypothetical protein